MTDVAQQHDQAAEDAAALAELAAIIAKAQPPEQPAPIPAFNHPDRWFSRADGTIVKLQGSPQAVDYYTRKGLHALTPAEAARWERTLRPIVLKEERRRAQLITTIRQLAREYPKEIRLTSEENNGLSDQTTDFLEGLLSQVQDKLPAGVLIVGLAPGFRNKAAEERDERERQEARAMAGVEVGGGAALAEKILRGGRVKGGMVPGSR